MALVKKTNKAIFVAPRSKFKKSHKGTIPRQSFNERDTMGYNTTLGIKAQESARISHKQVEHFRRHFVRTFKNENISFAHDVIPNVPVSRKSIGSRMGKGKASISYWINKLPAAKISFTFTLPHPSLNIIYYLRTMTNMKKSFSFNNRLVINNHFGQELVNILQKKKEFWTCNLFQSI